jgi:hypothetical protein
VDWRGTKQADVGVSTALIGGLQDYQLLDTDARGERAAARGNDGILRRARALGANDIDLHDPVAAAHLAAFQVEGGRRVPSRDVARLRS